MNAFASGDLTHLSTATQDRLHQPAREAIFYPMKNIFRAAMAAGALGVCLSGAGSAVLALARDREYTIGYEMADAAMKSGRGRRNKGYATHDDGRACGGIGVARGSVSAIAS